MKTKGDISRIFNSFTGSEVELKSTHVPNPAAPYAFPLQYKIQFDLANAHDKTVAEMKDAAEKNGLLLRLQLPEQEFYTDEHISNRVTARIEKAGDGKYRVSDFRLG